MANTKASPPRTPAVKITYYLEVISSWCYWSEPAWSELKRRYEGRVEFQWKIAQMPTEAYPGSAAQADWYYRRSGIMVRSPFMLSSEWFEPGIKQYTVPNLVAEAAKDFKVTDDRVRLAIADAALREGKKVGRWNGSVEVAAAAAKLNPKALLARAQSKEVAARVKASSAEFNALQVTQRPTYLIEDSIGDRAVFSGLVTVEPLAATIDAMLDDVAGYKMYAAHYEGPPKA